MAKELTERGVEVLMLEAGSPRVPTRDFNEYVWQYQVKFRGLGDETMKRCLRHPRPKRSSAEFRILKLCGSWLDSRPRIAR
ncbi:MAG: hypothetical protein ACRD11_02145 [Terriglobia bacterium]